MNDIRFIEWFGGVGGFRLGLERANQTQGTRRIQPEGNGNGREFEAEPAQLGKPHFRPELEGTGDYRPYKGQEEGGRWQGGDKLPHEGYSGCVKGTNGESARFHCVWYCDIDRYAVRVYNRNFRETWRPTDARRVSAESIPDFDLLCAGFPCQSFSIAGKRKGFQDTRGTLFFEIARIAKVKRPRLLLLENVRGLLSHDEGRTFQIILATLDELGYDVEWEVLNSKHFGVPQNRERVFIIGHLRDEPWKEVFPLGEGNQFHAGTPEETQGEGQWLRSVDSNYWKGGARQMIKVGNIDSKGHNSVWGRVYSPEGIATNLNSEGGGLGAKTGLFSIPSVSNSLDADGYLRFGERPRDEYGIPTLVPIGRRRIRRLTPTECERLQGFPDGWTEFGAGGNRISDTQRYKMCGNAVTVNVVTEIGRKILGVTNE